jgi:hypothetical protein
LSRYRVSWAPSELLAITNPDSGEPRKMLEIGTLFEGKGYYLEYFADLEDYGNYLPTVLEMIGSFNIVE